LPGKKVNKQGAGNIEKFNSLSLQAKPEKVRVIKKSGLNINESFKLKHKKEDKFSEYEEEPANDKKVRIVKKSGVSFRDRGLVKQSKFDLESEDEQEFKSKKRDKIQVLKKTRLSLRDQFLIDSNQSDQFSDENQIIPTKLSKKVSVLKKKGLTIRERKELESETDEYVTDYDETITESEKVRIVKKPTTTLRERGLVKPKLTEPFSGTKVNHIEKGHDKVRVVKRRISTNDIDNYSVTDDELDVPNGRNSALSDSVVYHKKVKRVQRKSLKDKYIETEIREEEDESFSDMSQRTLNNESGGDGMDYDDYDTDHQVRYPQTMSLQFWKYCIFVSVNTTKYLLNCYNQFVFFTIKIYSGFLINWKVNLHPIHISYIRVKVTLNVHTFTPLKFSNMIHCVSLNQSLKPI
jgi:hypothetical protein